MTRAKFIRRSVVYYWRTHLGVVLGAALGTMVLTGALLVGDSVKATLRELALMRIGSVDSALFAADRSFREALATELQKTTGSPMAPVVLLRGSLSSPDTSQRINSVQVLGVDNRFWSFSPAGRVPAEIGAGEMWINERVAAQVNATVGATLLVRMERPSSLSRDAPLSGHEDDLVALRARVSRIVTDREFGRFALQGSQIPPFTVFFPLGFLQERLGFAGRANTILAGSGANAPDEASLQSALAQAWKLDDAELALRPVEELDLAELRSRRVFIDPAVAAPAKGVTPESTGVLTYFVNELRAGERATPYSMVAATDAKGSGFLPEDLEEDEIVINQWLADDLGVAVGGEIAIKYYIVGSRRTLEERTARFRVRNILPMEGPAINPAWMPDFPGLSDAENCRDWKPGIPMDMELIRDKDEQYWDQYRGAPKGFIALAAGETLWSSRWGKLTAIRYPMGAIAAASIEPALRQLLDPGKFGLSFLSVRAPALAGAKSPVDFGQLFLAFSFFLITAAAVLTGLLFVFSVEQRSHEAGVLLATGLPPAQVRRLLLLEGFALAIVGTGLGLLAAWLYTRTVLHALSTIWQRAVGVVSFTFAATPATILISAILGIAIAMVAMWFTSRKQAFTSARALLAGDAGGGISVMSGPRVRFWKWAWIIAAAAGVSILIWSARFAHGSASPGAFFSAGILLLVAGIGGCHVWLAGLASAAGGVPDLLRLGFRNAGRRRGRSLAIVAVLASGVFIIVAVNAFRHTQAQDTFVRSSGTGGFAFIGESAVPIYQDLNARAGREAFGLTAETAVQFVPMRIKEGDDASCLNLNRAIQPRVLGVTPDDLKQRQAFSFSAITSGLSISDGWSVLAGTEVDGAVRAVVDEATLKWALGKKIGDTIDYTDDAGHIFPVRVVATVSPSILQGNVLISESAFIERFAAQSGYRFFLVDAPAANSDALTRELSRSFSDQGLELTPASRRLADFQAVENTYLSIFQLLGGLGLVLGGAAVGVVVARNVIERRREFGVLQAFGFRPGTLRRLVFLEHQWLIFWGLAIGILAACATVWPNLRADAAGFPWGTMTLLIGGVAVGYLFWAAVAVCLGLRSSSVASLRTE